MDWAKLVEKLARSCIFSIIQKLTLFSQVFLLTNSCANLETGFKPVLFCLGQVFLIILPNLSSLDWSQFNLWKVMKFNLRTQTVKNDFRSKNATKNLFSFSLKMLFFNVDTVSLKLVIFVQQKKICQILISELKKVSCLLF